MKKLLLIPLLLIFINCQNDIQTEILRNRLNFEPELTQQFFVAPDSIVNIKGKKGTKISFKTEDLEGILNGPNIKDSLYINLVELTTKQDLLLANTQTISDGKWLISGGAFKIEIRVKNGGESLTLKKGETINVSFPKTTTESGMHLFYGNLNENGNINWRKSDIQLKEKKYYSIYLAESTSYLDSVSTALYGVDMFYDVESIFDTLGYLSLSEYKLLYPKVDSLYIANDTLSNFKSWKSYEDFLANIEQSQLINESFYNSIETSKLGWINIDKFAPYEDKVKVKLNFKKSIDAIQTYIIDEKNNTVLNVENNELEIPINRSFKIISFGLKENTFYAFKKSIRLKENSTLTIEFKKLKGSEQIKSFLKLE